MYKVRTRSAIEVDNKVVILAAGEGKRLKTKKKDKTKAQTKVYGLSLIQRAILSAKKAGLSNFVVVVGYKKEILISYLKKISIIIIIGKGWIVKLMKNIMKIKFHIEYL
ncbi:unnamed protein product [marine sediment metagenome]|uniref:MobA-like NTP transferase domain-containing protein n=1 Tax=marine sediment metagenome TaxID=412755 RepID=X1KKS0_9ZZZZ